MARLYLDIYAPESSAPARMAASIARNVFLSLLFAALTGACARLKVFLPFTPVPVTGQVFAVLLSGAVLGKVYGPLSQMLYIGLGVGGVPWFVLGPIGPTGGYIIGFFVASFLIGYLLENQKYPRKSWPRAFLSMNAGVGVIYLLGLIQFSIFMKKSLLDSIPLAVLPFIPFDILKAAIAASAAKLLARSTRSAKMPILIIKK